MLASGIRISYGDVHIVDGLELDFRPGINLITGPSGSGKSTILKALFGTLKAQFTAWEGSDRKKILVLQDDALIPWLNGWENITLFLGSSAVSTESIKADPLFSLVEGYLDAEAWRMSFGQRRMIELLRTRMARPDILLLDEPLNYLDPGRKARIVHSLLMPSAPEIVVASTHETAPFEGHVAACWQLDGRFPIRKVTPVAHH